MRALALCSQVRPTQLFATMRGVQIVVLLLGTAVVAAAASPPRTSAIAQASQAPLNGDEDADGIPDT